MVLASVWKIKGVVNTLLVKGEPLDFNLFGKEGDANFTSARLWAKYDDGIPAVPEAGTMIFLGFGLAGLAVYRKSVFEPLVSVHAI